MQKNFIKNGDEIRFKYNIRGEECSLENSKVYKADIDEYGEIILVRMPNFIMPSKIYSTERNNAFKQKVLNQYENMNKGVLGVMLSGLKGSGKTIMAKQIALESTLPIILIDKYFHPKDFKEMIKMLEDTPVCIIFDEIDKVGDRYDMKDLLSMLDGTDTFGNILLFLTCNDESKIDENMKDRCSRIRYWKSFNETPKDVIEEVVKDKLQNKELIELVVNFIENNFDKLIFDNICAFIDEINMNPNVSFDELFEDMNLTPKE